MSSLAVGRGLEDLEPPAISSLAVRRGLEDLELWLAGLFTAAELAAADLLLQLSVAGRDGVKLAASTATTPSSSPRSASSCCDCAEEEELVLRPLPLESTELDRRARKRYRLLSDLYAGTTPVSSTSVSASASAATKKHQRKRHHDDSDGSSSAEDATRYGAETA